MTVGARRRDHKTVFALVQPGRVLKNVVHILYVVCILQQGDIANIDLSILRQLLLLLELMLCRLLLLMLLLSLMHIFLLYDIGFLKKLYILNVNSSSVLLRSNLSNKQKFSQNVYPNTHSYNSYR